MKKIYIGMNYNFLNYKIILSIILFFSTKLFSQSKDYKSIKNSNLTENEKICKIDSLLIFSNKYNSDSIFQIKKDYAFWLYKRKKNDKAINKFLDILNIAETNKDSLKIQNCYYYLGYLNKTTKNYNKSIVKFNNALKIDNKNKIAGDTYYQLGLLYNSIYDNTNAIYNFEIAISILQKNNNFKKVRNAYFYLSNILLIDNQISKGLFYARKADSLANIISTSSKTKFKIKTKLADFYNTTKNLKINIALKYYYEALKIALFEKNINEINDTYLNIGNLFNTTNYKKSLYFLNKISKKDCNKLQLYDLYLNYGLTYQYGKQYIKSILYFKKAISFLTNLNLDTVKDINISKLINVKHKKSVLHILPLLASTYLKQFEYTNKINSLEKSLYSFKLSDNLINLLKTNSNEFKSKLFWREKSGNLFSKAVKACFLNNNLEDAFYFIEKNKALLLMEDIAIQNYRLTLDVSEKLLDKEFQYKKKLVLLENLTTNVKNKDSILKIKIDLERTLSIFQDSIYKGKKNLIKEPKILSLKDVQKNIKENEVFIEYHISIDDGFGIYTNNQNGYAIFITKNKTHFFEINEINKLKNKVSFLINALKKPFTTQKEQNDFNKIAYIVFDKLFPNKEIQELIKNKKLIIAPDDYLSFLPFEILNTNTTQPNYLIKEHIITYLYSYSFLKNTNFAKKNNGKLLSFAPVNFNYDNLKSLPNSKTEVFNIKKYFSGTSFQNGLASKTNFIKQLPNYNIIHLATHANAQDSINPWIAFNDTKINLPELQLINNNASLVVLSACNTTLGKQETGEGVMSLARGFFYGGAQSVVSSLWSIDDKATPYIMNEFYKNLYNNQTKSEALRNAKLTYLENHSLSELSPHYWASFILLGKDDVILHSAFNWHPYLIGLILLILFIFTYRKLKNKKNKFLG